MAGEKDQDRPLESSGYMSGVTTVPPPGSNETDSNSQEASQQSFLSYLQDQATGNSGKMPWFVTRHDSLTMFSVGNSSDVNLFNNAASQLAAAYPYIYNEGTCSQNTILFKISKPQMHFGLVCTLVCTIIFVQNTDENETDLTSVHTV